ncbi:hypothetical protein [Hoeflea sp.]
MSRKDIAISIELLDIELRAGLPGRERTEARKQIAGLRTRLAAMEETEGA